MYLDADHMPHSQAHRSLINIINCPVATVAENGLDGQPA